MSETDQEWHDNAVKRAFCDAWLKTEDEACRLRVRVAKLEAALVEVADIQWAERRGCGRSRKELADHLSELQDIAANALKDAPQ